MARAPGGGTGPGDPMEPPWDGAVSEAATLDSIGCEGVEAAFAALGPAPARGWRGDAVRLWLTASYGRA
ncbi:hypothetical protein ASE35_08420 [Lysobacter sp. Root916]|nr:hypothetical protein ASE35_08420 [Lysobacter sp. Root916]